MIPYFFLFSFKIRWDSHFEKFEIDLGDIKGKLIPITEKATSDFITSSIKTSEQISFLKKKNPPSQPLQSRSRGIRRQRKEFKVHFWRVRRRKEHRFAGENKKPPARSSIPVGKSHHTNRGFYLKHGRW